VRNALNQLWYSLDTKEKSTPKTGVYACCKDIAFL